MTTPAQQACLDAADLIERVGWWNGGPRKAGKQCAMSAIADCTAGPTESIVARELLRSIVGRDDLGSWNDSHSSGQPVIAALRKAGGL